MKNDLRYAIRNLIRHPGFAAAAILSLALGLSINTALFTIVNGVLLSGLPFPNSNRLMSVYETVAATGARGGVSFLNYEDWRRTAKSFEKMAAYTWSDYSVSGTERADRVTGELTVPDYFEILGAPLRSGRFFTQADGTGVVVVSSRFWRERLAADPGALGRKIVVNNTPFTVIGIAGESFRGFSQRAEFWLPIQAHPSLFARLGKINFLADRDIHWHRVVALRKADVTEQQAMEEMAGIGAALQQEHPKANRGRTAAASVAHELETRRIRPALRVLAGAAAFVMLIACANLSSLLLARTSARRRELAIRASLGASRTRVVRQLLTESALLTGMASLAGFVLAQWGVEGVRSLLPGELPRFATFQPDWRVFLFSLAAAAICVAVAGLAPALRAAQLSGAIGARGSTPDVGTARMRQWFVAAEVALAIVLLAGAGVMMRSLANLVAVNPGFDPDGVATLRVDVSHDRYAGEGRNRILTGLLEEVRRIPGVTAAAINSADPFEWPGLQRGFTFPGRDAVPPADIDQVFFQDIGTDYFRTMGIRLLTGRDFLASEGEGVAIVSESFARKFFGGDALGKRMTLGSVERPIRPMKIVGVAGDAKMGSLRSAHEQQAIVYTPLPQAEVVIEVNVMAKFGSESAAAMEALRGAVNRFDPDAAVYHASWMSERLREETTETRGYTMLLGVFALAALVLAAVGIYGLMAFLVAGRTREFGVRIALGADPAKLRRTVLAGSLRLAAGGMIAGLLGASLLMRYLERMVFEVKPLDPWTLALVGMVALTASVLAGWIPAARAAGIDPAISLRED
jgi:putative ABC transport system permease protein